MSESVQRFPNSSQLDNNKYPNVCNCPESEINFELKKCSKCGGIANLDIAMTKKIKKRKKS